MAFANQSLLNYVFFLSLTVPEWPEVTASSGKNNMFAKHKSDDGGYKPKRALLFSALGTMEHFLCNIRITGEISLASGNVRQVVCRGDPKVKLGCQFYFNSIQFKLSVIIPQRGYQFNINHLLKLLMVSYS